MPQEACKHTWPTTLVMQVDSDTTVETLKAILEAETQVPGPQQALVFSNRILQDK